MENKKFILMILDGWGIGDKSKADAIYNAPTPNMDKLISRYPHSELKASGPAVGLPVGVMGNSEVGHLSIGAGRILKDSLVEINLACQNGGLEENKTLQKAFQLARGKNLHFLGLLSDAGVHSMDSHLYKLCDLAKKNKLKNVFIHLLSDGRDTGVKSGIHYVAALEKHLKQSTGRIASLIGRYYTMDRDHRWERIKRGYDLLIKGTGTKTRNVIATMQKFYQQNITDEFMEPIAVVDAHDEPIGLVKPGDVFICFNFRTDRLREITTALTQRNIPEFNMQTIFLHYFTMTTYDKTFKNIAVIFPEKDLKNTLGEVIARNGLSQLRIAETEKYPHVTFFFSGRRQTEFVRETRIVIPSPAVATYDLKPEMSALIITKRLIQELNNEKPDFVCLNFANGDMVGHTSVYSAVIKAVETVDDCVGLITKSAQINNYDILIIADHGNAEEIINKDGSPNTKHSLNPVPCILVSADYHHLKSGILADVAPTILKIMKLPIPPEMTGKILV